MSRKNTLLTFAVLNAVFVAINGLLLLSGAFSIFTLAVMGLNLYSAKVCYDGYKRSAS